LACAHVGNVNVGSASAAATISPGSVDFENARECRPREKYDMRSLLIGNWSPTDD
jgi:hypothetical protein